MRKSAGSGVVIVSEPQTEDTKPAEENPIEEKPVGSADEAASQGIREEDVKPADNRSLEDFEELLRAVGDTGTGSTGGAIAPEVTGDASDMMNAEGSARMESPAPAPKGGRRTSKSASLSPERRVEAAAMGEIFVTGALNFFAARVGSNLTVDSHSKNLMRGLAAEVDKLGVPFTVPPNVPYDFNPEATGPSDLLVHVLTCVFHVHEGAVSVKRYTAGPGELMPGETLVTSMELLDKPGAVFFQQQGANVMHAALYNAAAGPLRVKDGIGDFIEKHEDKIRVGYAGALAMTFVVGAIIDGVRGRREGK